MLKRWLKNRLLVQIFAGLLLFVVGLPLAALADEWGQQRYRTEFTEWDVLRAVDQYGADAPETMDALRLLAEGSRPIDLVAVLDPVTLRAVSAWPAENEGKLPAELTLSGGAKLPDAAALRIKFGQTVTIDRPNREPPGFFALWRTDRLETEIRQIYRNYETDHLSFYQPPFPANPQGVAPRVTVVQGQGSSPVQQRVEVLQVEQEAARNRLLVRSQQAVAILLIARPPAGFSVAQLLFLICILLAMGGLALYWLSTAWWVFADASRRGGRAIAWGLLVLLTNVVGVLAYLIARPERLLCPSCGAAVERHHAHCPSCGRRLKDLCATCGMALQTNWPYCPGCGTPVAAPVEPEPSGK